MIRYLLLLISSVFSLACWAQAPQLSATVDKNRILIGEPFQLELRLTAPELPPHGVVVDSLPFFEVMEQKSDTVREGNNYTIRLLLKVTSWDSGRRVIPPIVYEEKIATKPIPILVTFSSPFDPKQPYHDEKDILDMEPEQQSTWQWYAVLALVILLLALLLFPKRKKDAPVAVKPDINYYKKVLHQLQALQQDDARRNEPKLFYTELTQIFRQYIYKRKGYFSDADISSDLVVRLHQWRLHGELREAMRRTLENADLAKFAKYHPGGEVMDQDVQTLKKAVIAIEEAS
jgi:LPXTG-motif cell wall-anchored protein